MDKNPKKMSFQLLTLITTPKLADKAAEMFKNENVPLQYLFNGEGTASSEMMDMLGLGSVDKRILICMLPEVIASRLLVKLKNELQMTAVNSGIAFTMPLNGINKLILDVFSHREEDLTSQRKGEVTMSEYVTIAAIVNRGFSGDVMVAAREKGARGGTVIHSLNVETEEVAGFWGSSVQEEREIVLIIADSENKLPIMQNISEKCGMHSDAKGLVISMPIDTVIGV